jgi:hypothetical protein
VVEVIGVLASLALGIAISPLPVLTLFLLLLSRRALAAGIGFAIGWVGGILSAVCACWALATAADIESEKALTIVAWMQVGLGALLIVAVIVFWLHRPSSAAGSGRSTLVSSVDGVGPGRAMAIGFGLVVLNPKDLIILAAAGTALAAAPVLPVPALGLFVLLAGSTVLLPVAVFLVGRGRLGPAMQNVRNWLQVNARVVVAGALTGLGLLFIGGGLGGLS